MIGCEAPAGDALTVLVSGCSRLAALPRVLPGIAVSTATLGGVIVAVFFVVVFLLAYRQAVIR